MTNLACHRCGATPAELIDVTLWSPTRPHIWHALLCEPCAEKYEEQLKCLQNATLN